MARLSYKLEVKSAGNQHQIYMITPGDARLVCHVLLPNDGLMRADIECLDGIVKELRKRINKSL